MSLRKPVASSLGFETLEARENPAPIGYSIQSDGDNQLYEIDLGTGVATAIGSAGLSNIEGMSFNPVNGLLYGIDDATGELVTINIATGATTVVATTGVPTNEDPGLAFDAGGNLYVSTDFSNILYRVDITTGATTTIGSLGVDIEALSFNPLNGALYGLSEITEGLYLINPATAGAGLVGPTGFTVTNLGAGIDFDQSGVLWGLDDELGIFQLNIATGAGTITNPSVIGFESLAIQVTFSPPPAPPAPPPAPPPPTPGPPMASNIWIGSSPGQSGIARLVDASGQVIYQVQPYGASFTGGVNVASGDVTGDGVADLVTAPASNGGSDIRVFDGATGLQVAAFLAYDARFDGGASVAIGDIDGDGTGDIITGAGPSGGPHVRAFQGGTYEILQDFLAYEASFRGGISVASADFNQNGQWDIVTGAGSDGGAHVRVFLDGNVSQPSEYIVQSAAYRGGVNVAAGNFHGNQFPELAVGANSGGSRVVIFNDGQKDRTTVFDAYPGYPGGVRVSYVDPDGDGNGLLATLPGTGPGGGENLQLYQLPSTDPILSVLLGTSDAS